MVKSLRFGRLKLHKPLASIARGFLLVPSIDLAAEEDFHAVVELADSAGGEPEEFRKDCGADDRSLLGFN